MPVRRGHVAPQNSFIETIIRRFDGPNRAFVVANAQHDCGVIFVNEGFCRMSGFSRADVMQCPCTCDFLHGPMTSKLAAQELRDALATAQEKNVEILYYKKDGTKFLCQTTMCPIKNEDGETSMFIVNFQDLTSKPEEEEEDPGTPTDNSMQSRFSRARASFRQSFRMRLGKTPASGSSTSPGARMEPILDEPADEPTEEEEDISHDARESGESCLHDPLLGSGQTTTSEGIGESDAAASPATSSKAATAAASTVPTSIPADTSATASTTGSTVLIIPAGEKKSSFDALQVSRPSLHTLYVDDYRKTSLPIWRRKDSAASRKDSVATTVSKASARLGSFAEESHSRSSMRPATSLDAISHHKISSTVREFPSRSATISTTARNHVTKNFPNASSESDLSRYRTRIPKDKKSPSLSNLTAEGIRHKFSFQDPNAAKGLFPNAKHQKIDKVAQVGQVVSTEVLVFISVAQKIAASRYYLVPV
ncbi:potassium voltage-gated channel subfamily H member 2-like [Macrobrachium rosenbergii]|uniref:potassium voltage-gated channel subfamily H member 2-like n=1 Tax=Macrobrachium rosenbergii TaxID=79674 RepID=UPI0034D65DDB